MLKYLILGLLLLTSACNDCVWQKKDIENISDGYYPSTETGPDPEFYQGP